MGKRLAYGLGKVLLASVLVALILPFIMAGIIGRSWGGPR